MSPQAVTKIVAHPAVSLPEQALRQWDHGFRLMVDALPSMVWISDVDGRCVYVNRAWVDYTGRRMEQELGDGFTQCIHPDDLDGVRSACSELKKHGTTLCVEYRLRGADGMYRWFLDKGAPRFGPDDTFLGYVGVLVDISDRRRLEEEIIEAKERAEIASRTKSEFLANMSHELRTPLNAIIGFSEIMKDELLGAMGADHYRDYARDIHFSGRHLLDIINDVLDLAKMEAGRLSLSEEVVDLVQVVSACMRLVHEKANAGGVLLAKQVPEQPLWIRGDQVKLKQILVNLLSNAVKFTPNGGSVRVRLLRSAEEILLEVVDTGIGMRPDEVPVALLPFRQLDNVLSRQHSGTGLGLPLTKGLVEMHGGALQIESAPGAGTTVRVAIPGCRLYDASGLL